MLFPPLVQDVFDEEWEATIARNEFDVELWLEYASDKQRRGLERSTVCSVFERALARLPGSYKLWHTYLKLRMSWLSTLDLTQPSRFVQSLNSTFTRSLLVMGKYPQIWLLFAEFLSEQRHSSISQVRSVFDSALRALPPTQHGLIWSAYVKWVFAASEYLPSPIAVSILKRHALFVKGTGGNARLVEYFQRSKQFPEAVRELLRGGNDAASRHVLDVLEICELSPEAAKCTSSSLRELERAIYGIKDQEDKMLALERFGQILIHLGEFDFAREVFEYALFQACDELKHFTRVFETYSQFEERAMDADEEGKDAEFRNKRMRRLLDARQLHVSQHLFLRKYPGDVQERIALAEFYAQNSRADLQRDVILQAFAPPKKEDASLPVDLYNGNAAQLFSYLGELERGTELVTTPKDLIELWKLRIEKALTASTPQQQQQPLKLAKESLVNPKTQRSGELWALYLDLEQSLGTFESMRAAYESAMELKTISVLGVLNYARALQAENYFEDSFNLFERALILFPGGSRAGEEIYIEYSKTMLARYGSAKLERMRDLFEQWIRSLHTTPLGEDNASVDVPFFLYAKFETDFGLNRNVMHICERWVKHPALTSRARCDAYLFWAKQAEEFFGSPSVRNVLDDAMRDTTLKDEDVVTICVHFAHAETRLGEHERARAIYKHGAFFQDPSIANSTGSSVWQAWNAFEVAHGNEDTFREMLRVKRSVQVHYSVLHAAAPPAVETPVVADAAVAAEEANPEEIDLEEE